MKSSDVVSLSTPLREEDVRKLKVGMKVRLNGIVYSARDMAHRFLVEEGGQKLGGMLRGGVLYHCGPVVRKTDGGWDVVSAGPTTSMRMESYEADVIRKYKVRAVIGKGGMGEKTLNALRKEGCVYLSAVGGAGTLLAAKMAVKDVHMLEEFGVPEAIWEFRVKDFPAIVTMDSHGGSIHEKIFEDSKKTYKKIVGR